jgi:hypothetical protein
MSRGLFLLLKGAPNAGKSVAALSFPDPFVMDFDRKMPTVAEKHFPNVDWTGRHKSFDTVFEISDWLQPYLSGLTFPFESVIVDTVTSLSTTCLRSIDKTKGTDVVKLLGKISKEGQVDSLGFDYYKGEMQFFERYFIDNLKILWAREGNPRHIIVIAHEIVVESFNIMTNKTTRTSSIVTAGNKVAAYIPKNFDEEYVCKLERPMMGDKLNKSKRLCITSPDQDEDARTCFPFPEVIDFSNKSLYEELKKYAPSL